MASGFEALPLLPGAPARVLDIRVAPVGATRRVRKFRGICLEPAASWRRLIPLMESRAPIGAREGELNDTRFMPSSSLPQCGLQRLPRVGAEGHVQSPVAALLEGEAVGLVDRDGQAEAQEAVTNLSPEAGL